MSDERYMDFSEAVTYLSTTRSTLYKWLQTGKVPGHKLGRQWRFLEDELSSFRTGNANTSNNQKGLLDLEKILLLRREQRKEKVMSNMSEVNVCEVAEDLIWDATNSGSRSIHMQPKNNAYEVSYRNSNDLEVITEIDKLTFHKLNSYFQEVSTSIQKESKRRFFLGRKEAEGRVDLHIKYQQLETVTGERVSLKINRFDHPVVSLKDIAHNEDLETLEKWCSARRGIIVFSGGTGSGKTTTLHCVLNDLAMEKKLIFTMEDPVDFIIEGVNQVEVDHKDLAATEEAFHEICDSDLDILCLGLSTNDLEENTLKRVARAAEMGYLVLLQMHQKTAQEALDKLIDTLGTKIEEHIVGVSSQVLTKNSDGSGSSATYTLLPGKLSLS